MSNKTTAISPDAMQQLRSGNIISYITLDATHTAASDMTLVDEASWKLLAHVSEVTFKTETEDDAFKGYHKESMSYTQNKNTAAIGDSFTATCEEYTQQFHQLRNRAGVAVNGKSKLYTHNRPHSSVWLRIEKFDDYQKNYATQFLCGELRLEGDTTENDKFIRAKIAFEVKPAEHNCEIDPAVFNVAAPSGL